MKKKVLSFMVCFCLMAGVMSGCGDSEGSGNTDTNNVETAEDGTSGNESEGAEQTGVSDENGNGNDLSGIEPEEVTFLAKETQHSSDGSIYSISDYEYDENGNLVKTNNSIAAVIDFDGNPIRDNNSDIEYEHSLTVYEYDANNNKTKEAVCDEDGNISHWWEYEYDANNNMTKYIWYGSDGSIFGETEYEYEYDANNNVTKRIQYNSDGSIYEWIEYEYDAKSNLIKEIPSNPDLSNPDSDDQTRYEYEYEYEYDVNNNKIKSTEYYFIYLDDELIYEEIRGWTEWEYDANSNMTKETSYFGPDNDYITQWTEWEYDANNNMTKRISYDHFDSILVWIEYEYITTPLE